MEGADSASLAAARKYGLNEAEILALRTYTAEDYTYINPATANAPGWLLSQNPAVTDPKNLAAEGSLHAGVMMEALSKLPVKKARVAARRRRGPDAKPGDYKAKSVGDNAEPGDDKPKPGDYKPKPVLFGVTCQFDENEPARHLRGRRRRRHADRSCKLSA